ncbi:hypothetical protein [Nocardioides flavescens]|uniref:Uncharacterized protein n=1 Tax=Nocardioides flavescens TaxID=2691959 RepID=A0A6L7EXN7_9ACTN|nr:hypothetical protein [Nocardioides flavescens]MXG88849.1 hypothetical protein [Nocardioides flavescens]
MATEQTATSDSWADDAERHPLDDEPTRTTPVVRDDADATEPASPARRRRGLGGNRHLSSIVLAFLAVVAGYGCVDYGYNRAMQAVGESAQPPQRVLIVLGAAAGLFFLAALTGRISALGPLLAGLVLGVGPLVWVMLDFASFVDRLNDLPEFWDNTGFGLYAVAYALFPAVAGLLVGTAVAGRWRRHHPAPTTTV